MRADVTYLGFGYIPSSLYVTLSREVLKRIRNIVFHRCRPNHPGEIWKRRFNSEKASNAFRPYCTGDLKTKQSTVCLDSWLRKFRAGKSHFKLSSQARFHWSAKAAFSNNSVLENLCFRGGLVWTEPQKDSYVFVRRSVFSNLQLYTRLFGIESVPRFVCFCQVTVLTF